VDALRETRASHSHQSWGSFNRDALPRLLFYGGNKFCQFSADKLHAADQWFVIGDIHGDFYALHTIVAHIRKVCPQFGIIFLGDLIDRGPHPIECLWYMLKLADDHPERVLWLAGNHDVGARYDEVTGEFRSTVEPAEFVADLNIVDSFSPLRRAFGREYIELAEGLPRAALMPDGLLLTHGGFPHTDLQVELAAMKLNSDRRKWLESDAVIRDFTHLRITKYPLRRPNRLSISCSYGYQDFASFKQSMSGYGIKRLVTGHQHAASGFDDHPEWAKNGHEALTLTGFGFADAYDRPDSYGVNYRRTLTVGRCRPDRIPEVVTIPVHEQDLMSFYEAEIKTMPRFAIS
jgi:UDP-2,3-diacylglucosamine pyrophosphatase LpxH